MMTHTRRGLKAVGECVLLPFFLLLVFGVCLPWLTLRRVMGRQPAKPRITT